MKACINCKFALRIGWWSEYDCTRKHSSAEVPDPINGGAKIVDTTPMSGYRTAADERASILPWNCGIKARHHVPKASA